MYFKEVVVEHMIKNCFEYNMIQWMYHIILDYCIYKDIPVEIFDAYDLTTVLSIVKTLPDTKSV